MEKTKKKLEKIRSRGHNNDAYVHVVVMRKKERKKENRNGNWVVVQGVKERAINESERERAREYWANFQMSKSGVKAPSGG